MKFRVKMTLCMLALLSALFGAGGSLLISASFQDALERREELRESTARRLDSLIAKLDRNEELIRAIMERKK